MAVVNGTIAAHADDIQIYYSGGWSTADSSTIWFGRGGGYGQPVALRFTLDAAIPAGATIDSADLKMYGDNADAVDDLWVYVTESGDGAQVTLASQRPAWIDTGSTTTYPTTDEGAGAIHWVGTWTLAAWNTVSITSLIQYLVNTYGGLASGAHIVAWVVGDNAYSNVESGLFSYGGTYKATLTINYTPGGQQPGGGAADDRFRFRPSQRI
jgi:hypothetical protein